MRILYLTFDDLSTPYASTVHVRSVINGLVARGHQVRLVAPGGLAPSIEATCDPLPPGKFLRGTATSSARQMRTIVPRRLLDRGRLLIIRDGVIRSLKVEVAYYIHGDYKQMSPNDDEWAVLAEQLPAGTAVILAPMRNMSDGMSAEAKVAQDDASVRSDDKEERPSL